MRKVVGVAVLLFAARLVDATAAPTLADCATRLESVDADVADVCPDVDAAIAASPFANIDLPGEGPSKTDIEALHHLTAAFGKPHANRIPDVRKLDRILAGLQVDAGPKSLWQLFNDWVHERWRELVKSLSDVPNPLAGLNWHWPDWGVELLRSMGWGLTAMLAALAALGLIALARAANRQVRWSVPHWLRRHGAAESPPSVLADLVGEPLAQQVRLLLQIVLRALRRSGRLIERSALTHRELVASATDLNERERQALANVAMLAERVTYSSWQPTTDDIDVIVEQSRALVQTGVR
jgi:hypothetical protein